MSGATKRHALHLSVVNEVDGEDENPDGEVHKVQQLDVQPKHPAEAQKEAKDHEDKEDADQHPPAHREVDLGLSGGKSRDSWRWI